jgi:D-alanyl-D-alanine carboxypeptidase
MPISTAQQEPAPLTSGVISSPLGAIPGSSKPITPVRVKTVQVRMTQPKTGAAPSKMVAPTATSAIPVRVVDASSETPAPAPAVARNNVAARPDFPAPLPIVITRSTPGLGEGTIGPVPGSAQVQPAMAYADSSRGAPPTTLGAQARALESAGPQPAPLQVMASAAPQPEPLPQNDAAKGNIRRGWIVQVGALESESEARQRLDAARESASRYLSRANPFTEVFSKGSKTYYRARFAGLDQDSAEATCKVLKRADISCMTVRN